MKWLGLCGKAGAGKDWLCTQLTRGEYGLRVHRVSIAATIKEMLLTLNPRIEGHKRLQDIAHEEGGIEVAKWTYPEIRRLMQVLGTQCGRELLGPHVWISAAMARGRDDALNVVTDVRFPNEVDAIRAAGGLLVLVERPDSPSQLSGPAAEHVSERTGRLEVDHVFTNSPGIAEQELDKLLLTLRLL